MPSPADSQRSELTACKHVAIDGGDAGGHLFVGERLGMASSRTAAERRVIHFAGDNLFDRARPTG